MIRRISALAAVAAVALTAGLEASPASALTNDQFDKCVKDHLLWLEELSTNPIGFDEDRAYPTAVAWCLFK